MTFKKYIVSVILMAIIINLFGIDAVDPYVQAAKRLMKNLQKKNVTCSNFADYCAERVGETIKLAQLVSNSPTDEAALNLSEKLDKCKQMVEPLVCENDVVR